MNNTTVFSCKIGTTDAAAAIGVEIWLDQEQIFNVDHVKETIEFTHKFDEDGLPHRLRFIMKNKTEDLTIVDDTGFIVADARLIINNIEFDEIEIDQLFCDRAIYTHNFNGTQPEIKDRFFGEIGCNGIISLDFTTPVYIWLLENS